MSAEEKYLITPAERKFTFVLCIILFITPFLFILANSMALIYIMPICFLSFIVTILIYCAKEFNDDYRNMAILLGVLGIPLFFFTWMGLRVVIGRGL